jgi:hypothetical protein
VSGPTGPTDPRDAGGEILGGDSEKKHENIIDTRRAVMMDYVTVAIVHLERKEGEDEDGLALELSGKINGVDEQARILFLLNEYGAASIVAEISGLIARAGEDWPARFKVALSAAMANVTGRTEEEEEQAG